MWSYDDKCCEVKKKKYIFKLGPRGNKMNENEYVQKYREMNSKQTTCATWFTVVQRVYLDIK